MRMCSKEDFVKYANKITNCRPELDYDEIIEALNDYVADTVNNLSYEIERLQDRLDEYEELCGELSEEHIRFYGYRF